LPLLLIAFSFAGRVRPMFYIETQFDTHGNVLTSVMIVLFIITTKQARDGFILFGLSPEEHGLV
jgi:hypothetical protein